MKLIDTISTIAPPIRFKRAALLALATGATAVASAWWLQQPSEALTEVTACNVAPYRTVAAIVVARSAPVSRMQYAFCRAAEYGHGLGLGLPQSCSDPVVSAEAYELALKPGECAVQMAAAGALQTQAYYRASFPKDDLATRERMYANGGAFGEVDATWGFRASASEAMEFCVPSTSGGECTNVAMAPVAAGQAAIVFDPALGIAGSADAVGSFALDAAREEARRVHVAVARAAAFIQALEGDLKDQPPFHLGIVDQDRCDQAPPCVQALVEGVRVHAAASHDIFGRGHALRAGETILAVNGMTVYGQADMLALIADHGLSKSAGIGVPLKLAVRTQGGVLEERSASYYFNESSPLIARWRSNSSGLAFGLADGATLGHAPAALCAGGAIAGVVGKLFGGGGQTEPLADCVWRNTQLRAMSRQFDAETYSNGLLIGGIGFSPLRLFVPRTGLLERAALDAVETGVTELQLGSPSRSAAEAEVATFEAAEFGGAVSLAVGAVLRR